MGVRTNEEIYQRKCVMKREMRKNQILILAQISVRDYIRLKSNKS